MSNVELGDNGVSEIVPLPQGELRRLGLRGHMSLTGWELPEDMAEAEWEAAGVILAKIDRGVGWWIGDWWAFGEKTYGKRKAATDKDGWKGPTFQACADCGMVSRKFETSRRREVLGFTHHREVAALDPATADKLLDWCEEPLKAGEKSPRSTRELRSAAVNERNFDRIRVISEQHALFPEERYPVIYADPPWQYDHALSTTRQIENQYPTMDIDAICSLPVESISADRAMLFLWVPPSFLHKGLKVIEAWGFSFLTSMVWDKERDGMGYYVRQRHENLLFACRGEGIVPAPSTLSSSIVSAPRGEHSVKPEKFAELIERMYPGLPKIELFRRGKPRDGWAAWGNQALAA